MRVALDCTPLLGRRTGIGRYTEHLLSALAQRSDVSVAATAFTARGIGALSSSVPPGVRARSLPVPARLLRAAWTHSGGADRRLLQRAVGCLPRHQFRAAADRPGGWCRDHSRSDVSHPAGHCRHHQPCSARVGAAQPGQGRRRVHAEPVSGRPGARRVRARGARDHRHTTGCRTRLALGRPARSGGAVPIGPAGRLLPVRRHAGTAQGSRDPVSRPRPDACGMDGSGGAADPVAGRAIGLGGRSATRGRCPDPRLRPDR